MGVKANGFMAALVALLLGVAAPAGSLETLRVAEARALLEQGRFDEIEARLEALHAAGVEAPLVLSQNAFRITSSGSISNA